MNEEWKGYRQQIDEIDSSIIKLLTDRAKIVEKVRPIKWSLIPENESFIKTKREIDMVREVPLQYEGKFPREALAYIWRNFINGSIHIEHDVNVACLDRKLSDDYWYAREYFGFFTEISEYQTPAEVIAATIKRNHTVGVLGLNKNTWWNEANFSNKLTIFGILPYIISKHNQNDKTCFMFSEIQLEGPSVDSKTVVRAKEPIEGSIVIAEDGAEYLCLVEGFQTETAGTCLGSYGEPARFF